MRCSVCREPISEETFRISMEIYRRPLCPQHQDIRFKDEDISPDALLKALQARGAPAQQESYLGVQVISLHHLLLRVTGDESYSQAAADTQRALHAARHGLTYIRIPGFLIDHNDYRDDLADSIIASLNDEEEDEGWYY